MSTPSAPCSASLEGRTNLSVCFGGLGASTFGAILGGELDGSRGRVGPKREKLWTLRSALKWLGSGVRVSGRQVECLLGHYVFEVLYSRGALSVFRSLYTFVHDSYMYKQPLWESARREALIAAGLLPLVGADLRRRWHPEITTTDASTTGWGICKTRRPVSEVESMGVWNERWRYRRLAPNERAPRRRALGATPFGCNDGPAYSVGVPLPRPTRCPRPV